MEQSAIAESIKSRFPDEVVGIVSHQGQVGVLLKPGKIVAILSWLKDAEEMCMDHLRGLCGVDNSQRETGFPERFEVMYQLYSTELRHGIRLRVLLPEGNAHVDSVVPLWAGADWLERETYDMFGIQFDGHPNMTRVLMPEDWEGYPLLKDYPLRGPVEWQGLVTVKEKAKEFDQYGFYGSESAALAVRSRQEKQRGEEA